MGLLGIASFCLSVFGSSWFSNLLEVLVLVSTLMIVSRLVLLFDLG